MKRILASITLFAAIAGFTVISAPSIDAQVKKEPPTKKVEETKKIDPKKDVPAGLVEIYKGKAGMRFRIVDAEGKTVAMPPPSKHWETREDVVKALDALKHTLNTAKPTDVKE